MAFIDHYTHLYKIVRHQLSYMQLYNTQHAYKLLQNTVFYGVLHRLSPATFLQLKIQLEMHDLNPRPSKYQSNGLPTELS